MVTALWKCVLGVVVSINVEVRAPGSVLVS